MLFTYNNEHSKFADFKFMSGRRFPTSVASLISRLSVASFGAFRPLPIWDRGITARKSQNPSTLAPRKGSKPMLSVTKTQISHFQWPYLFSHAGLNSAPERPTALLYPANQAQSPHLQALLSQSIHIHDEMSNMHAGFGLVFPAFFGMNK
jgi:hypothetical protein